MSDWILSLTELPNLHPALVHFPLALLPVAIGFDLVALAGWLRRRPLVEGSTAALYALAALTAWAAVWAGEEAEDSLSGLSGPVEALIEDHEEWGHRFLYAVAAVAVARLAVAWWSRRSGTGGPGRDARHRAVLAVRSLVLVGALAALGLALGTADRGGGLVFRAGVAVMAVPAEEVPEAPELPMEEVGEPPDEEGR